MTKLENKKGIKIDSNDVIKVQHSELIEECQVQLGIGDVEHNFSKKLFDIEGLEVEENEESITIGYIVYDENKNQEFYLIDPFMTDFDTIFNLLNNIEKEHEETVLPIYIILQILDMGLEEFNKCNNYTFSYTDDISIKRVENNKFWLYHEGTIIMDEDIDLLKELMIENIPSSMINQSKTIFSKELKWFQILRMLRAQYDWSQTFVAKKIGCDQKQISRWEKGKSEPIGIYKEKIAEIYGVEVSDIFR